jgi:hypothetical protein
MSTLQAAALLWPALLVVIGLVIGRVLRRTDRTGEPAAPAVPAAEVQPVESGSVPPEPGVVPEAMQRADGPDGAGAPQLRVRR